MSAPEPAPVSGQDVPVCPRHPDRVSYVRCQRCGRPACPECQRQAAVGVHCVDCVRESARTTREARTAFGAPLRGGRPVVTLTLIGLCLASFALQLGLGPFGTNPWTASLGFVPALASVEPWRFLTTAFLHSSGFWHIAFNMYALWILGSVLEPALGRWRFLMTYLLAALGGSVAYMLFAAPFDRQQWNVMVVGASGAVFGLFGALLVVLRRVGADARGIVVIIAINGVLGFVVPNIAWQAHLGGFVVGALLGLAFAYAPRDRRVLVGIGSGVLMAVVLVTLAAAKYAITPDFLHA